MGKIGALRWEKGPRLERFYPTLYRTEAEGREMWDTGFENVGLDRKYRLRYSPTSGVLADRRLSSHIMITKPAECSRMGNQKTMILQKPPRRERFSSVIPQTGLFSLQVSMTRCGRHGLWHIHKNLGHLGHLGRLLSWLIVVTYLTGCHPQRKGCSFST